MTTADKVRYSEDRRRPEKAASYDTKYEREWHKRVSDRREKKLLESILARVGRRERLLDVPCGAGRLSGVMAPFAEHVFEVDYSVPMLEHCRDNATGYAPLLANADALVLPFADRSFDVAVSIRLSHHLPDRERRVAHLRELLRVTRGCVVVTFFGTESFKNRMRELRRRLGSGKSSKKTLSRAEVATVAGEHGFALRGTWQISALFSGHYFALLERTG